MFNASKAPAPVAKAPEVKVLAPAPRRSSWQNAGKEIEGGLSPLLFQGSNPKGGAPLVGEYPLGLVGGIRIQRPPVWALVPQVAYLGKGRWNLWVTWVLQTPPQARLLPWGSGEVWVLAPQGGELEVWSAQVRVLCAKAREEKAQTQVSTWALVSWWLAQGFSLAQVRADARRIFGEWLQANPRPKGLGGARSQWEERRALQVAELRACKRAWLNATARDRWATRGASAQRALEARLDRASGARPLSPKEEQALLAPSQEEANALLLAWQERASNPRLPGPRPEGLGRVGPGWAAPLIKDEALQPKAPKRGVLAESQAQRRAQARDIKANLARGVEPLTLAQQDQLADQRASELITQAELAARLAQMGIRRGRPRKG